MQVRHAREENSLRLRSLEETLQKLSGRGELQLEVTRLAADNSTLKRSEARLRADVSFAQEQQRLAEARSEELL